jgi:hypothetical protein
MAGAGGPQAVEKHLAARSGGNDLPDTHDVVLESHHAPWSETFSLSSFRRKMHRTLAVGRGGMSGVYVRPSGGTPVRAWHGLALPWTGRQASSSRCL